MMAAYAAAESGHAVTLLEQNEKLGKKLFITGKGRCNLTNASDMEQLFANVVSNRKFLYSAFYSYDNEQVISFFESHGMPTKTERGNRVFPVSDHSSDVIAALSTALRGQHVEVLLHTKVNRLLLEKRDEEKRVTGVELADHTKMHADAVIVATGGISYPSTGATGDGYRMAEESGHKMVSPTPALVPMEMKEPWVRDLQGLSLRNVRMSVTRGKKKLYEDFGEMLFTHFGVSGPLVLSASGCIPAKAMIHASSLYREMQEAERFGISASDVTYDYGKIVAYKEETTDKLVQGVEQLLKANGVDVYDGKGTLLEEKKVRIRKEQEDVVLEGENIILASGSKPLILPIPGMDSERVLTSDALFAMKEAPKSLIIIGGGVISVEFATVYANLGCKITILEAMPKLVPNMDKEISQNLKMILKKRGIDIHTSAAVQGVTTEDGTCTCHYIEKDQEQEVTADYVLCAVGRCPNTDGLFGENVKPDMERGRVLVNANFESSIPGVYAIGDLIFGAQLAHAASAQGIVVAEKLAGKEPSIDLSIVPGCVYTDPEIASAGMTEDQAKENGIAVKCGKFIMSANGKSIITQEERGFIKVVADEATGKVLGAQMMCARATDMIGEFVTAITNGLTVEQMLRGMRSHPTYNEGIGEALEELEGGAVHVVPRKKK